MTCNEHAKFEEAWNAASRRCGEAVSASLKPLLQAVNDAVTSRPPNLRATKKALTELLHFLGNEGRTDANCWVTDLFFCLDKGCDWAAQELPEDLHDILSRMGSALHDTVSAKDIAEDFGCLPEQLLADLRKLPDW